MTVQWFTIGSMCLWISHTENFWVINKINQQNGIRMKVKDWMNYSGIIIWYKLQATSWMFFKKNSAWSMSYFFPDKIVNIAATSIGLNRILLSQHNCSVFVVKTTRETESVCLSVYTHIMISICEWQPQQKCATWGRVQ